MSENARAQVIEVAQVNKPRGIRNNNPGNIEYSRWNDWRGQLGSDGRYAVFDTPENGIRALGKLLSNYFYLYGIDTVKGIIDRWAPPVENNTAAYIAAVSARLGVEPGQTINVMSALPELVKAIIHHENGQQPYSDEQISRSLALL